MTPSHSVLRSLPLALAASIGVGIATTAVLRAEDCRSSPCGGCYTEAIGCGSCTVDSCGVSSNGTTCTSICVYCDDGGTYCNS